ncbi:hypothetical protein DL769_002288 [Monosporascus sp. CRB-8-3]|nr:hypothetical protein DL769_002288 [Monosporascus sp. CRB-8-3]
MDPASDSVSRSTTSATSGSARSFLGRSLIRRETKTTIKDEQEGPRGPTGLTTLYEPDDRVVVDLIFVHGLNGGSQSTWSKGTGDSFWPRDWLPHDEAFSDVRIHTFGYSSAVNRESILNIHDFANNLLACVHHSPAMASEGTTPIVFIGHSMGGLVVKKAYILGHQLPEYESLVRRVCAVFFLATPHQGAGIAQLLSRVLALAPGSRPFVNDLSPQSGMLQSINEEFPRYSQDLQLFSFYETQPMYYGIGKGLIVEKHCAVMNYPNERRTYLDANHRDVARFSAPSEPSYVLIRNALAMTVENQRSSLDSGRQEVEHDGLVALSRFLEAFSELSYLSNNWKDTPIDKVDHNPVWRRIFSAGLLKVRLKRPQYWVIDALDECRNGSELIKFLGKAQEKWPLCVLVTSRAGVETYITGSNPSMDVISETILEENKSDIAAFITANLQNLPGATTGAQQSIADRILHNSNGCFLWVNLVLKELRQVHTSAEISQVLDSNPSDMDTLYCRILDEMSHAKFGKDLAKAILTWTTCAFRPLSTEEIHYAIEKDIKDSIDDIGKSINSCCSNLVYIDKARKVQLVHLTAREFLTRKGLDSEYRIDRASGHKRLALVCLQVLSGGQGGSRRPSKSRRPGTDVTTENSSALHGYASTYLFQHLLQVRSSDNEIFIELANYSRLSKPMNIASSEDCTALALSNGNVIVYDNSTLLERHAFKHGEPVWSIAFGNTGKRLATGGAKAVRVWDLDSSEQLLTFKVPAVCMALAFMEEDDLLVVVTKNNCITYWDVVHGNSRDDPIDWTRDLGESDPQLHLKRPTIAAFSVEQSLLAVIYRGEDILLWSLDEEQVYDMYTKDSGSRRFELQKVADGSTTVWAVAFSTTIEANLLVAAYSDGDVIVFDTESGTRLGSIDGINAQTISCSPDGRTLATADSHGIIHLFDLKTLKFIYRLRFDTDALRTKMLAFTSDNLRLLDIRGHQFRVWDPTVLLRHEFEDENSDTVSCSTMPQEVDYNPVEKIKITSIACMRKAPVVFCGKEDGSLHAYDITGEPRNQELFTQTPNCAIIFLHFDDESGLLTCSDEAGRVTCRKIVRKPNMGWDSHDPVIDLRNEFAVLNAITSGKHSRLLTSTSQHDTLWSLSPENTEEYIARTDGDTKPRWAVSPLNDDVLVRFEATTASFFSWKTLERVRSVNLPSAQSNIDSVITLQHPQYLVTARRERPHERGSPITYHLWDFRDFMFQPLLTNTSRSELVTVQPALDFGALGLKVESIIGVANERIIFLTPDNWVCSAEIGLSEGDLNPATGSSRTIEGVVRHFFIPDEWSSLVHRVLVDPSDLISPSFSAAASG